LPRKREQRTAAWASGKWDEAARHYDDKALATLVVQIALINAFNRLNATTRAASRRLGVSGQGYWRSTVFCVPCST
jgi:hypothetical protein